MLCGARVEFSDEPRRNSAGRHPSFAKEFLGAGLVLRDVHGTVFSHSRDTTCRLDGVQCRTAGTQALLSGRRI